MGFKSDKKDLTKEVSGCILKGNLLKPFSSYKMKFCYFFAGKPRFIFILFIIILLCNCKKKIVDICPNGDCPPIATKAVDREASWSPTGDSLVFLHTDSIVAGIFIMDTTGVQRRFVLSIVAADNPRWSPKDDWIVFGYPPPHIYKIKTNGDSLTQLTFSGRNFLPNWSPDGNLIIYDRTSPVDSAGVWIMNADGSNKRWVAGGRSPSFSPDGSKILYVSLGEQVVLADTTGGNVIKLTSLTGGTGTRYPSFSPLGNKIVFQYQLNHQLPSIWVMNSDGSNLKQVTTGGGYAPFWSPNGARIVYTNNNADNGFLWLMNPDGSQKNK